MNTLRLLRYAHFTDLNTSESYEKRLKRINKMVIIFSKYLMDELLFDIGWVGYGKE